MTASRKARLLAIPLVWLPVALALWLYAAAHDLAHSWHQLQTGHPVTWPPPPKTDPRPGALDAAQHILAAATRVLRGVAVGGLLVLLVSLGLRVRQRRYRARVMARWELRLGRDDLAVPYRVQEM